MNHSTPRLFKTNSTSTCTYPQTIVFFLFSRGVQMGSTFCTVLAQDILKSPFNFTHEPSLNYRKHN